MNNYMDYNKYLDDFVENIYEPFYTENDGGMKTPDMFILYVMLCKIKPDIIIESGVWKGQSTKLIRKTVGEDSKIICIDPRPIFGWQDDNDNTIYYTDTEFKDFKNLDLSEYKDKKTVAFFDDHVNQLSRLKDCYHKKIKNVIFNDNYPKNCGSHLTLQHVFNDDNRFGTLLNENEKRILKTIIEKNEIYPNIFPGKIKTGEGYFDCESYFKEKETHNGIGQTADIVEKYKPLYDEKESYRWNTLVELKY